METNDAAQRTLYEVENIIKAIPEQKQSSRQQFKNSDQAGNAISNAKNECKFNTLVTFMTSSVLSDSSILLLINFKMCTYNLCNVCIWLTSITLKIDFKKEIYWILKERE